MIDTPTPQFIAVEVSAEVRFIAYVRDDIGVHIMERIASEIEDAIEYHAPRHGGHEPGDALVAIVDSGTSESVLVEVRDVTVLNLPATVEVVEDAIRGAEAWR